MKLFATRNLWPGDNCLCPESGRYHHSAILQTGELPEAEGDGERGRQKSSRERIERPDHHRNLC